MALEEVSGGSTDDALEGECLGLVQCIFQDANDGVQLVQLRRMLRGADTVLGDAASEWELFVRWGVTPPFGNAKAKGQGARPGAGGCLCAGACGCFGWG